jgi:hypothetical protein
MPIDDELLNTAQVGATFGPRGKPRSKPWVYAAVKSGLLPPPDMPGLWWKSNVQKAIDAMKAKGNTERFRRRSATNRKNLTRKQEAPAA